MDVDRTDILDELIKYKGFSKKVELAKFLGIKPNVLSNWYSRNTFDEEIIIKAFPDLNKYWLLTGEGSMLKNKETLYTEITPVPEHDYMMVEFEDLETAAGKLGGGDVSALPEKKKRLVPREYQKGHYLVVRVHGHSMDDNTKRSITEGDELLIKECNECIDNLPIRTRLFVLVTREGSVIKQITKIDKKNKLVTCHSFNPQWEDYTIPFDEIAQVFTVEKKVRSTIKF